VVEMMFFEDPYLVRICDEINFEKLKNLSKTPTRRQLKGSHSMKNSFKIFTRRNVSKKFTFFCFGVVLEEVGKP
jgi:hypothetical protein